MQNHRDHYPTLDEALIIHADAIAAARARGASPEEILALIERCEDEAADLRRDAAKEITP